MRKIVSILLSVIMLISVLPSGFSAFAEELSSGKCGDNATYSFDSSTGTLTISGTGDMWFYNPNESPFSLNESIKKLVVKSGITSIGTQSFERAEGLEEVVLPDSIEVIENSAFGGCINLKSINLPYGLKIIGNAAFSYCESLESLTVPDSVTNIGSYAFEHCLGLTDISLPKGITIIDTCTFAYCESLKSIRIPDSVTDIKKYSFYRCKNLKNVTISSNATAIGENAFAYCESLTSVSIPSSVKEIEYNAFYNCESLNSVNISDGVEKIGIFAFSDCNNIKSLSIPKSVIDIDWTSFERCHGIEKITVSRDNPCYDSRNNCNAIVKTSDNEILFGCKNTVIPKGITSIGKFAFYNCYVKEFYVTDTVTKLGWGSFSESAVEKIHIPTSVKIIEGYTFDCCYIKEVHYGGTVEQWNKIEIGEANDWMLKAKIYCTDGIINDVTANNSSSNDNTTQNSNRVTFTRPSKVKIKSLKKGKKKFTVKWAKVKGADGYVIQYSHKKNMKSAKKKTVKGSAKTSLTVKKLKSKKYYVRVRAYKVVNGKRVYGKWSAKKAVKVK